jgi:cell division protein FtsL
MIKDLFGSVEGFIFCSGWVIAGLLMIGLHFASAKIDKLNIEIANKNAAIEQQNTAIADLGEQTKKAYAEQLALEKKIREQRQQDKAEVEKILNEHVPAGCDGAITWQGEKAATIARSYNQRDY